MIPLTRALASKREALLARSREQRADLIFAAQPLARSITLADRVSSVLRARPLAIAAAAAAFVAFGPRKLVLWGLRFAPLLSLFRRP